MTRHVTIVGPEFPLPAAWQLMQRHRFRHLPIVQDRRLVGIVSDRDILVRASRRADGEIVVPREPVAQAMTAAPITGGKDTRVGSLVKTMTEHHIDAVPVVDDSDALVGLVTSTDLLLLLAEYEDEGVLPFDFRVLDAGREAALA
jgi:acetoin utilization protein AcuB